MAYGPDYSVPLTVTNSYALHLVNNPAKYNYLTIERKVPLRMRFFPDGSGTRKHVSKLVKDLEVQRGYVFSPSAQYTEAANKARLWIFMIRRFFQDLSKSVFIALYGACVRPQISTI